MKMTLTLITHCLLVAGMLYAVVVIAVVPAAACTTSQCSSVNANAGAFCWAQDGGSCTVGRVIKCDSSGFSIVCRTPSGQTCLPVFGQCS